MPWNVGQKIYIRDNGEFQGSEVWDDDATADENVDANRHDTHDQDIAGGISACLNKDGINEMAADLKMATHKIVGLLPGTAGTDGVNKDQTDAIDTKADQGISDAAAAQATADTADGKADQNVIDIAALDVRVTALEAADQAWGFLGLADGEFVGIVGDDYTSGTTINRNRAVIKQPAHATRVLPGDHDDATNIQILGITTNTSNVGSGDPVGVLHHGYIRNSATWAFTIGAGIYVDSTGSLTETRPAGATGNRVGIAVAADIIYVFPVEQGDVT